MTKKEKSIPTLVIADLHLPFEHENYLEHCIKIKNKYKTKRTILIGDIQDAHASSRFETNPDGYSAIDELNLAKNKLKLWKKEFKKDVYCVIGNHDMIPARKLFSAGISNRWIKGFNEIFDTPNWNYDFEWIFNDVLYTHGQGGSNLINLILNKRMNVVIGHFHTKFEINYNASTKDLLWGMCVGCGISPSKYAFEYAKYNIKRPIIGCGVVIDNNPYLEPMIL